MNDIHDKNRASAYLSSPGWGGSKVANQRAADGSYDVWARKAINPPSKNEKYKPEISYILMLSLTARCQAAYFGHTNTIFDALASLGTAGTVEHVYLIR